MSGLIDKVASFGSGNGSFLDALTQSFQASRGEQQTDADKIEQRRKLGLGLGIGGAGLQVLGAFGAGSAARSAGSAARSAKEFEAAQLEQGAGQAIGAGQRGAEEQRRQVQLVVSRALALAAASGGGASDVTVQKVIADLDGEGAYRAMVALYQGEDKARQMRMAAAGARYEGELAERAGKQQQRAAILAGVGTGATSAGSLWLKYGQGGPQAQKQSKDAPFISDNIDSSRYG